METPNICKTSIKNGQKDSDYVQFQQATSLVSKVSSRCKTGQEKLDAHSYCAPTVHLK